MGVPLILSTREGEEFETGEDMVIECMMTGVG